MGHCIYCCIDFKGWCECPCDECWEAENEDE